MKHIVFLVIYVCVTSVLFAQTPNKPFSEMTFQELKQVEQNTLEKAERKAFKKAYKKAKRNWAKAEKLRKKAEKKRLRAEAKRQKAEKKARQKREKLLSKRLKDFNRSYTKTKIIVDEYESHIWIKGPRTSWQANSSLKFLLSRSPATETYMRAFYRPDAEDLIFQIYVAKHFSEKVPVTPEGDPLVSPMQHAVYERWWGDYHKAALRGGIGRKIIAVDKDVSHSAGSYFDFYEDFVVYLESEDLFEAIHSGEDLGVKVSSRSRSSIILTLTPDYIAGFLKKLSETDSRLAHYAEPAQHFIAQASQELGE